ncbi:hypothetical protein FSS13T_11300 [Flavobacterium saliperosum S13]|uniref:Outer membrane protein beta-barrel domain-containing protein n=2 Tax=Flavobacterium saliperosum TaxID=329186 RepID=A0A1G4W3U5_9FLAO|nr:outer membrane beta-barrel protein [Flavobacterium saliperosum]ESU26143.1 hypothetical protein FSS13T_11300 [Flavobacterium saliperosum S13]SCX16297.1 Outer membrane protein beta-barrel domain-containing protein [Flavobacterium saliperosum]
MSEKNNIDRLFQEKFKDFEVAPSDKVWENIQLKMNTKEKKTNLLPFWLRLCSFAAVFLIGFSVATTFIAGPFGFKNPFDSKESTTDINSKQNNVVVTDSFEINNKENNTNTVVVTENGKEGSDFNAAPAHGKINSERSALSASEGTRSSVGAPNTVLSGTTKSGATSNSHTPAIVKSSSRNIKTHKPEYENQKENTVVSNTSKKRNSLAISEKNNVISSTDVLNEIKKIHSSAITASETVSATSVSVEFTADKTLKAAEETDAVSENSKIKNSDADFEYNVTNSKVAYESGNKYIPRKKEIKTVSNSSDAEKTDVTNNVATTIASKEKSKDAMAKSAGNNLVAVAVIADSLAENEKEVAEKTAEEKVTEEKDSKDKKDKKTKWIVSTTFSPVYMNLNGSGSTLDSKFAENSKSYQTSMSYGVGLKYALNNKWTVRTGVNALNFEYNTNDITFYNSNNGAGLEYVNENGAGTGMVIENPNPKGIAYNDDGVVTTRYKGNINQRINYIEVPLELSYKILNKKIGIDVIGGVSSMFLNDNRVSVVTSESSTNIGEANNLNKLHFSTNVGLGLRYSFMKTFQANLEPMFKYQINTYSGDAGNFKPYFIGVYSGISFSF